MNKNDFLKILDNIHIEDKLFYCSLTVSLIIHFLFLIVVVITHPEITKKPLKQIEVVYQSIKQKKTEVQNTQNKKVYLVKEKQESREFKMAAKKFQTSSAFGEKKIKDISKIKETFKSEKKQIHKISTLDVKKKIFMPDLKNEKITNPKYLSYDNNLRAKVRQWLDEHLDYSRLDEGEVYITFVVDSTGLVKGVQIKEDRTNASDYLRESGLRSIRESSPFPPLPKDLNYPEMTFKILIKSTSVVE